MDGSSLVPGVWAQVTPGTMFGGAGASPGGGSLLSLSLRRWFASLTLSPPSIRGGEIPEGLWAFLGGLGALLLLVLVVQGPRRAFGQLVDLKGHVELWGAAVGRVRRSGRLLMAVVGVSVVAWTASQTFWYARPWNRDDLALLLKNNRVIDVAWAQGALAALTPLRDIVGLGLMIPMLLGAAFVLFQYSTFRWSAIRPDPSIRAQATRWATLGWGATAVYAIYRFVSLLAGGGSDRPLGGCLSVEALVVPALMALADGVLVAWVLVELRHGGGRRVGVDAPLRSDGVRDSGGGTDDDRLDVTGVVLAIPSAVVGCVLAFPARYVATGVALGSGYLPPSVLASPRIAAFLRWELSWGLVAWQAAGLLFVGWFGAAAWSQGARWGTLRGFGRMLRADGGRVLAVVLVGGVAAGVVSALAYLVVLALPGSTWALNAADSYAHYGSLPVGLVMLAALVELGGRSAVSPPKPPEIEAEDWADLPAWAPGSRSGSLDTKQRAGL